MSTSKTKALGLCAMVVLLAHACGGSHDGGAASTPDASGGDSEMSAGADSTAAGSVGTASSGGMAGAAPIGGDARAGDGAGGEAGAANRGELAALTIVTGVGKPSGIALSEDTVYWASEDHNIISSCPKSGCVNNLATLVVTTTAPRGIAISGSTLYWITAAGPEPSIALSIQKCTLGACAVDQIVDLDAGRGRGLFGSVGLAIDDQRFYFVGGPDIDACPISGCGDAGASTWGSFPQGLKFGVAVDSSTAYATASIGGLYGCAITGCPTALQRPPLVNSAQTMAVTVDDTNLYWSEWDLINPTAEADGAIRACPKSGCDITDAKVLAAGTIRPYGIAVDDANLFYTDNRNGRVERIPKTDFAHQCASSHGAACCSTGSVKCDGTCSVTCADAGTN